MLIQEIMEIFALLDAPDASVKTVQRYFEGICDNECTFCTQTLRDDRGETDCLRITIPGADPTAPKVAIVGRLGAVAARPDMMGYMSDGDGALCVLAAGAKLVKMHRRGERLQGDVIVTTHISTRAKVVRKETGNTFIPPIHLDMLNDFDIKPLQDIACVLSVDTTKGNRISSQCGFHITPTVKAGYILPVSNDLVSLMEATTGQPAKVLPLCQFDLTPFESGYPHINIIMTPSNATDAPVVGVALTAETMVPGFATGTARLQDLESASRFVVEAAKAVIAKQVSVYDEALYQKAVAQFGPLTQFQMSDR